MAAWTIDYGVTTSWSSTDAATSAQSGSLALHYPLTTGADGLISAGAFQCVPVTASAAYDLAVQLRIVSGPAAGSAGASVWTYASPDCSGPIIGVFQGPQVTAHDAWTPLAATTPPVGAGLRSAAVRLVAQKPGTQATLDVLFDNVVFKRH